MDRTAKAGGTIGSIGVKMTDRINDSDSGGESEMNQRWKESPESPPPASGEDRSSADILAIYDEVASGLLRYAVLCTGDSEHAREVTQEAFLALIRNRGRGVPIPNPRTWLFAAVRRQILRKARRMELEERSQAEVEESLRPAETPDPETLIRRKELRERLYALASPRELEILQLRAEGLKYHEIAGILDITTGTVGSMLNRVLRKVHKEFREEFDR
jgi:RNA polymerase sigma-70 factor (ECF subfamily)